jgi:hypothetical protein
MMLKSARWLSNHGVMLTYSGGAGSRRFIPPDGQLTVGEATKLLGLTHTRIDRLAATGRVKLIARGAVRVVSLAECRRVAAALKTGS